MAMGSQLLPHEQMTKIPFGRSMRPFFNLVDGISFVNHGGVGTCPKPVLETQMQLLAQFESHPDRYFCRDIPQHVRSAAAQLAEVVGAEAQDVAFVVNATTGVNSVLRSLDLQEGDEVLCLNLAYPAVSNTLRFICYYTQSLVNLEVVDIPLPPPSREELVARVVAAITPNTRLAVFDHITSPHSLLLPINELVAECHARGVQVLVDGAHALGQLCVNLRNMQPDYYVGNCYKWLFAPKGCSFLYVKRELQSGIRPVVTSLQHDNGFEGEFLEQGTRCQTPFLCLPAALGFYASMGPDRVYAYNKELVEWAQALLTQQWGTKALLPREQCAPFMSVVGLPLPVETNGRVESAEAGEALGLELQELLIGRYGVQVGVPFAVENQMYLRVCAQLYNERDDYLRLSAAVVELARVGVKQVQAQWRAQQQQRQQEEAAQVQQAQQQQQQQYAAYCQHARSGSGGADVVISRTASGGAEAVAEGVGGGLGQVGASDELVGSGADAAGAAQAVVVGLCGGGVADGGSDVEGARVGLERLATQ